MTSGRERKREREREREKERERERDGVSSQYHTPVSPHTAASVV
jgi:hypothetical protein